MIYYYIKRAASAFENEPTYAEKLIRVHNILRLAEEDDEVTPEEMSYFYDIVEKMHAICNAQRGLT